MHTEENSRKQHYWKDAVGMPRKRRVDEEEIDSTEILKVGNSEQESLDANLEASFKEGQGSTSGCRAIEEGGGGRG
jgi:hypothetical protein